MTNHSRQTDSTSIINKRWSLNEINIQAGEAGKWDPKSCLLIAKSSLAKQIQTNN